MARRVKRLSARFVDTIGKPGRYADGDGLYLIVSPKGAKRWQFLFRWQGKLKEMGLGSQSGLGLSEVREMASEARKVVASGRNPIDLRRASRELGAAERAFGQEAEELIAGPYRVFVTRSIGGNGLRRCRPMRVRSGTSRLSRSRLPTFSRSCGPSGTQRAKPHPE